MKKQKYRLVKRDGITAILVNKGKFLLVKRLWLPFWMANPGIWTVVGGGLKKGEPYLDAAYREVDEEVGVKRNKLKLLGTYKNVLLFDPIYQDKMWYNHLFVFHASSKNVKLNFENKDYRWASFDEIADEKDYTNVFVDKDKILDIMKKAVKK